MPHIALRLSEGTLSQLREVVQDESRNSKETVTERSWLVAQVNALAGQHALAWRQLEGSGQWQAGSSGPPLATPIFITPEDLREFKFSPGDGGYRLFLADKTVLRLERACAITDARNRAIGIDSQQLWSDANAWLERNLAQRIAEARAALDIKEIRDEQRAAETNERLAAERARRVADATGPGARAREAGASAEG